MSSPSNPESSEGLPQTQEAALGSPATSTSTAPGTGVSTSNSTSPAEAPNNASAVSGAQGPLQILLPRLRVQVEFYFGQQNLSRDTYLRNLLAQYGGVSVPTYVICSFPKVRDMCLSFNVAPEPIVIMRALEGSQVTSVSPDANWISLLKPLPPLDPKVKMRPLPLGPRNISIPSAQENMNHAMNANANGSNSSSPMNGKGPGQSPPNAQAGQVQNGPQGQAQGQAQSHIAPSQQQQSQQPTMVRQRSHSNQHQPFNHLPLPHTGLPVPPVQPSGYPSPHAPFNYPPHVNVNVPSYRSNIPPPQGPGPNSFPQQQYIYPSPHMQPGHGHHPISYPIYPGSAGGYYVTTNSQNYFNNRPGMVRNVSTSSNRSAPQMDRRQSSGNGAVSGGYGGGGGGANNGSFRAGRGEGNGPKSRKNRNRNGIPGQQSDYYGNANPSGDRGVSGTGGKVNDRNDNRGGGGNMSRRGSRELHRSGHGNYSDELGNMHMTRNRSQNEMSDSSGGGKNYRRNKKNTGKSNKKEERRNVDVSFDDQQQFPALSPSTLLNAEDVGSNTASAEGEKGTATVTISGYAAALLQKKDVSTEKKVVGQSYSQDPPTIAKEQATAQPQENSKPNNKSPVDEVGETDNVVSQMNEMKLTEYEKFEAPAAATPVAVAATPLTSNASDKVTMNGDAEGGPTNADEPSTNAKIQSKKPLENNGPTPHEASGSQEDGDVGRADSNGDSSSQVAAPPSAWGTKRSFIDVVRKQA